jgi:hypothetical protein
MYCPQCGQQQVSNEVRFCSRCGFPLGSVTEILAAGGYPAERAGGAGDAEISPRRKGARQGALLIFIGILLAPLLGVFIETTGANEVAMIPVVALIWGGIMRILYALIFQQGPLRRKRKETVQPVAPLRHAQVDVGGREAALPPAQSIPVSAFTPGRTNTSEMSKPPSVTENTTRLLDEQADPQAR